MKKLTTLAVLAATSTLAFAGAASAQPYGSWHDDSGRYEGGRYDNGRGGWTSINQRQTQLDRRIDVGVRNGQLTRQEAWRLRGEFNQIARLEARYRQNGLSNWERADLDRRFDRLSAQIRYERRDGQEYGYGYGPRY
jgi:hypothetical protein